MSEEEDDEDDNEEEDEEDEENGEEREWNDEARELLREGLRTSVLGELRFRKRSHQDILLNCRDNEIQEEAPESE